MTDFPSGTAAPEKDIPEPDLSKLESIPKWEGGIPSWKETAGAAWRQETLKTNAWNAMADIEGAIISEMLEAAGKQGEYRLEGRRASKTNRYHLFNGFIADETIPPEIKGQFPSSREELRKEVG